MSDLVWLDPDEILEGGGNFWGSEIREVRLGVCMKLKGLVGCLSSRCQVRTAERWPDFVTAPWPLYGLNKECVGPVLHASMTAFASTVVPWNIPGSQGFAFGRYWCLSSPAMRTPHLARSHLLSLGASVFSSNPTLPDLTDGTGGERPLH